MTTLFTNRVDAIIWAKTLISDPSVVFLDTETTGIGDEAEIVDIAVVDRDGCVLLDSLIFPLGVIPAEATAVHGIRDEDVETAPYWGEIAPRLGVLLQDRPVCVYNASFDLGMVNQCNRAIGLPLHDDTWQCAMEAFAAFRGEPQRRHRPGLFRWHSLATAAAWFGVEPGTHRALADAETCRQVVMAMAKEAV